MSLRTQHILLWTLRILVSGLFLLSAYSKLFPAQSAIFLFEKQIVDLSITNWCFAPLLARAIVSFEIFLGLAVLQNHLLKNIIIPSTFLLLLAFCIHLSITIYQNGNVGSCGCFGELIPMTPLEAIIKNVITMGMLVYLFLKTKSKDKVRIEFPFAIFAMVYLAVFMFFQPKCCCSGENQQTVMVHDSLVTETDSTHMVNDTANLVSQSSEESNNAHDSEQPETKPAGRKKVMSIFSKYSSFSNGTIDLNAGKKIVCLFSLDCEHCQESSVLLHQLQKKHAALPPVYVLAFGEESQVSGFFAAAGGRWPYTIVPPQEFFPLLGAADYPPRIVVMDQGNFLGDFMNFEHLDTAAVMRAVRM